MKSGVKLIILSIILIFLVSVQPASASLNLSANPADGGNTLRLGRVDGDLEISKAVKLRVSTNDGKQYQVFQRLEDSLTNERQNILDSQAINTYTLGNSNASGTLYSQQNEPLRLNDQLLYTSSPDGQSDTLTIVYAVNPDRMNASGNFMGRIAYIVRSTGGGSQDQVFLNVYLEASGDLKVEVAGATLRNGIRLEYNHRANKNDAVRVKFSGNVGDEIKVYQEVRNFPQDELGRELEADTLMFTTSGAKGELYYAAPEAVVRKKVLLYKSRETEDDFQIDFVLGPELLSTIKAGTYRGKIDLTVETAGATREFPLDVEIKIDPVFEVNVQLPPGGIRFSRLLPTDPPQEQEINVQVNTNLGKPYMVIHTMAVPLTNPKGQEIKADYFTMKMEVSGNAPGRIASGEFVPVKPGETPVYFSDGKGSPAQFRVVYRLRSYPEIAAGDYSAPIVYSLGEM